MLQRGVLARPATNLGLTSAPAEGCFVTIVDALDLVKHYLYYQHRYPGDTLPPQRGQHVVLVLALGLSEISLLLRKSTTSAAVQLRITTTTSFVPQSESLAQLTTTEVVSDAIQRRTRIVYSSHVRPTSTDLFDISAWSAFPSSDLRSWSPTNQCAERWTACINSDKHQRWRLNRQRHSYRPLIGIWLCWYCCACPCHFLLLQIHF